MTKRKIEEIQISHLLSEVWKALTGTLGATATHSRQELMALREQHHHHDNQLKTMAALHRASGYKCLVVDAYHAVVRLSFLYLDV